MCESHKNGTQFYICVYIFAEVITAAEESLFSAGKDMAIVIDRFFSQLASNKTFIHNTRLVLQVHCYCSKNPTQHIMWSAVHLLENES